MNKLAQIYNQFLDTVSRQHEENNPEHFVAVRAHLNLNFEDSSHSIIENPLVQ